MAGITAYDESAEATLAALVADARRIELRPFEPGEAVVPEQCSARTDVVIPDAAAEAVNAWV